MRRIRPENCPSEPELSTGYPQALEPLRGFFFCPFLRQFLAA
nr:MAG TPA: hypothetical protein [Caudoviricetes sp.]